MNALGLAIRGSGYPSGYAGMYEYLHDLRTTRWPICSGPDWAYIAFFTKYWTDPNYPAYAQRGGPRFVIPYDDTGNRGGYRVSDIQYLFAHETGHIFGAPDEYPSRTCRHGEAGLNGYLREPNGNCQLVNPKSVPCLMSYGPDFGDQLCQHTLAHFGWRDSDGDGIPDAIDPAGPYATDVGITPGNPHSDNADLWIRNQDDGETNQSHQDPRSDTDNFIYARVRNFGGVRAEVVRISFYIENYNGTDFVYPNDYSNVISAPDAPCPAVFCLDPGASTIAKVRLRQSQIPPASWKPCLLVHVSCVQDKPVPNGSLVQDTNNLAQKDLVINYVAP
jgi:hypothetical protein